MKFEDKVSQLRIKKHKGRETKEFLLDVIKMAKGEPLEYLLGEVKFCNVIIDLSLRPMIPREETEYWVKQAIDETANSRAQTTEKIQYLDLFAGSGCVGISALKNFSNSEVTFVEIDKKSFEQIKISLEKNKINKDRANIVIEDCVKFLQDGKQKFDAIFCVPPYVPPELKDEVMTELVAEEPLFFFDQEDGFYYIKEVLKNIGKFLNKGGTFYMEFDITQREKIEELIKERCFDNYSFLKDPYGHDCCVVLKV